MLCLKGSTIGLIDILADCVSVDYQFAVYFICVYNLHKSMAVQKNVFFPYSSINLIVWSCILLIILMLKDLSQH